MDNNPGLSNMSMPYSYSPCPNIPYMPVMPKMAHAYVPYQYLWCIYTPMRGLDRGTIFPELDRPYGVDPEYTVDA